MSRATSPGAGGRAARSGGLLVPLLLLAALAFATGTVLFCAVLLLPTLAFRPMDGIPGRPATRAMAMFAIAACLPEAFRLWDAGGSLAVATAQVLDPALVARAWASQGTAWLVGELVPALLIMTADGAANREVARLREKRERLAEGWLPPAA